MIQSMNMDSFPVIFPDIFNLVEKIKWMTQGVQRNKFEPLPVIKN